MDLEKVFKSFSFSPYRRKFKLHEKERDYLEKRGFDLVREDAKKFVTERISPSHPRNDGHQTPMRNHPVFIAQHATAFCCRKCIEKWHNIPRGHELTKKEIDYAVDVIMRWIEIDFTSQIEHPFVRPQWGWGAQ